MLYNCTATYIAMKIIRYICQYCIISTNYTYTNAFKFIIPNLINQQIQQIKHIEHFSSETGKTVKNSTCTANKNKFGKMDNQPIRELQNNKYKPVIFRFPYSLRYSTNSLKCQTNGSDFAFGVFEYSCAINYRSWNIIS